MCLRKEALHTRPQDAQQEAAARACTPLTKACARCFLWARGLDVVARLLFTLLGTIFLFIGLLGVVLPLLPATPFLLLASACYVRGSPALHRWLMHQTSVGTYLTNLKKHRGMPRKAKIMTLAVLWASLLFSIYRVEAWLVDVTLLMVGLGVTALIVRLKTVGPR